MGTEQHDAGRSAANLTASRQVLAQSRCGEPDKAGWGAGRPVRAPRRDGQQQHDPRQYLGSESAMAGGERHWCKNGIG